jgi:tetratricopeptide (TPR) repeat protein
LGLGSPIVYLENGSVAYTSSPDLDALELCLLEGMAGSHGVDPRETLGCDPDAADAEVARALVQAITARGLDQIGTRSLDPDAARHPSVRPPTEVAADPSFLGRLSTTGSAELSVERIDDMATLLAVLRAGSRQQRRAALARVRECIADRRLLHTDDVRKAIETIAELRDVELGYELARARTELPGGQGRAARHEYEKWKRLAHRTETAIRAFWDGQSSVEPIHVLPGDQRALLLLRIRELSDTAVHHISAIIEGSDGGVPLESRVGLIASLRYASDRRLVPALVSVLEAQRAELVARGARVLGGVEDARVHPALVERFERSFVLEERLALAGALGMHGDCRGLAEVRSSLEDDQPQLLLQALEAMETLGSAEHTDLVARFIDHPDVVVATQAVRTTGRIGDGRALDELTERYNASSVPALRAAIEDALSAVAARMELRGEEAATIDWSEVGNKPAPRKGARDSVPAITLGWHDYFMGRLWLVLGRQTWAIARFESAAARRNGWAVPLIGIGMAFARRGQYALALPAFRRAIEIDRPRIERNPILVRAMAKSFLHRAEQVEREGRDDVARGLVGEALTLDLRRAPGTVRFELKRKHDVLRREERDDVHSAA